MIAIQLTDTGQWLELPPDISLRYEMLFPAFDFEFIQTNVVYNFEFTHAGNEAKLNHAHVLQVNRTTKRYNVAFYVCGVRIFDGNMYVQSILPTKFSAVIVENNLVIDFPNTSIKDMNWPEIVCSSILAYAYDCIFGSWPNYKMQFPQVYAPQAYSEENDTWDGYANNMTHNTVHVFNSNSMPVGEGPNNNNNALLPMPYVAEVVQQMQEFFGLKFIGNIIGTSDFNKLIMSNMRLADACYARYYCKVNEDSALCPIYYDDPGLFYNTYILNLVDVESDEDSCWQICYYVIQNRGYHSIKASYRVEWWKNAPGEVLQINVILDFSSRYAKNHEGENGSNVTEGNFTTSFWAEDAEVGKPIYFRMHVGTGLTFNSVDAVQISVEVSNASTSALNSFDNVVTLQKYLPDVPASTFINSLRLLLGGALYINSASRTIELSDLDSIIDSEALDLTECLEADNFQLDSTETAAGNKMSWEWGDDSGEDADYSSFDRLDDVVTRDELVTSSAFGHICLAKNELNILLHYFNAGAKWKILVDFLSDLIIGTESGAKEIKPGLSPMRMYYNEAGWIVPYLNCELYSTLFGTGQEATAWKVAYSHGLCEDTDGYTYPLASPSGYDYKGNRLAETDLAWDGENGLYEKKYKRWIEFVQNTETMTTSLRFGIEKFLQIRNLFSPQEGTKKTRKIRLVNIDYIPEKISVIFTNADTWECEAIMRKKGGTEL